MTEFSITDIQPMIDRIRLAAADMAAVTRGAWPMEAAPMPHFQLDRDGTVWQNIPDPTDNTGSVGIDGEVVSETE